MSDIFRHIPPVKYEGPDTKNPLAFRYYDSERQVIGMKMSEHLRFSMAFWHSTVEVDTPGMPTIRRSWDYARDDWRHLEMKVQAIFELTTRLGIPFFCFHDRDLAPASATLRESNRNLDRIVDYIERMYQDYPTRLLWGAAQLFPEPYYMNGAATSPEPQVFACAAGQVKKAMEITRRLGGQNYVFRGGLEGYETLLNTNMKKEMDNMGYFLTMARDYARKIGFRGQLLLESSPREPARHQYDSNVAASWGFLQEYGLEKDFRLNIGTNSLTGNTIEHELAFARSKGIIGSVDANEGNVLSGRDTGQLPKDIYIATGIMMQVLLNGGLGAGGLNFGAGTRRPSMQSEDLVQTHITGMDTMARGLLVAAALMDEEGLRDAAFGHYAGYDEGIGREIDERRATFESLEDWAINRNVSVTEARESGAS